MNPFEPLLSGWMLRWAALARAFQRLLVDALPRPTRMPALIPLRADKPQGRALPGPARSRR